MEKQFVPYELALKFKEKGFDEDCLRYYGLKRYSLTTEYATDIGELLTDSVLRYLSSYQKDLELLKSPLWQQVIQWFRDNHDIHIDNDNNYSLESYWWNNGKGCGFKERVRIKKFSYYINRGDFQTKYYESPYEALEEAIEHALTLI